MTDWPSLILRNYESKDIDYKAPCAWKNTDKKACCELVKDILAMANVGGGWLVIGVSESGTGFTHIGVNDEQAESFETTQLNKFVNNYADPPVNVNIHKPDVHGKRFIVIEISGFSDTPHICQKDYPEVLSTAALYVRTDNNESAPLKSSADFRSIVERAIRNRADQILSSIHVLLRHGKQGERPSENQLFEKQKSEAQIRSDEINPHRDKDYGYRVSIFYPDSFDTERFSLSDLMAMASNASTDLRGWPFLFFPTTRFQQLSAMQDGYDCLFTEPWLRGEDELHYWQLRQSGMLYVRQLIREDTYKALHGGIRFLDFDSFSIIAYEAVLCLIKLYDGKLEDSENVTLQFGLKGMQDRRLSSFSSRHFSPYYSCHLHEIIYKKTLSYADWKAAQLDCSLEICEYVFHRFNWDTPNLAESKKLIQNVMHI